MHRNALIVLCASLTTCATTPTTQIPAAAMSPGSDLAAQRTGNSARSPQAAGPQQILTSTTDPSHQIGPWDFLAIAGAGAGVITFAMWTILHTLRRNGWTTTDRRHAPTTNRTT